MLNRIREKAKKSSTRIILSTYHSIFYVCIYVEIFILVDALLITSL